MRDKNGNGTIDNGTELFGDNTVLNNGNTASNGFAALADLDSNQDGLIDTSDAAFADLRVWQDQNQDGISQASELKTLAELDIVSISTAGTATGTTQNGNTITHTGTFTKTDGSTGETSNLNLATSTFHTDYIETAALNETDLARPDVHGSGSVHNLRNAAAKSATLASALESYSIASTREQQQAQLDNLLNKWSATSSMKGMAARAADNDFVINFTFGNLEEDTNTGDFAFSSASNSGGGGGAGAVIDFNKAKSPEYIAWFNKLNVLERFNGTAFIDFDSMNTDNATSLMMEMASSSGGSGSGGGGGQVASSIKQLNFTISQAQLDLLQQSYDALKQSVYESLLPQTRFKPYLDAIGLDFIEGEFQLDYSAMEALLKQEINSDNNAGVIELFEFTHVMADKLDGWDYKAGFTVDYFSGLILEETQSSTEFGVKLLGASIVDYQADSSEFKVIANHLDNKITGFQGNDFLYGNAGNDTINGNAGNDHLDGSTGDDVINGGSGNDYLEGGAGNDTLNGGTGTNTLSGGLGNDTLIGGHSYSRDTYLFNLGDGQDEITDKGHGSYADILRFGGSITQADVTLNRDGHDLIVVVGNNNDQVTVKKWFDGSQRYFIESFEFSDGTSLSASQITEQSIYQGTAGDDVMTGTASYNERFNGNAGDDTINGGAGNDYLEGGAGNDTLNGGTGRNTLSGGLGNDTLIGGHTYSRDTYLFNLGDGQDEITDNGHGSYADSLQFGASFSSDNLWFTQEDNDLLIQHVGSDDQVLINDWFLSANNQIEQISVDDAVLSNTKVANLVTVMSAYDAPTGSDGFITEEIENQLASVMADSWSYF